MFMWTVGRTVWKMPSRSIALASSLMMKRRLFHGHWFTQLDGPLDMHWNALRNAMVHSSHEYRSVSSVNILSRKSTSSASKLWILWGPNYCSCWTLFDFQAATICYALTTRETRTFSGKGSIPFFNGFSHLLAMLPRVVLPWNRSHFHIEQCLGSHQGGWNHCFEGRIQPIAPSSLSPTRK